MLAPIILFVYNRPLHTQKTLDCLKVNDLAIESDLYIFADGPKDNDPPEKTKKINEVATVIANISGFKQVYIIKRVKNIGLAANIQDGVTSVVNKYGKVIVLEDDIVTSPGFLKYMNDALDFYENNEKVMHISGYMYPHQQKLPETFFYNVTLCWGWATWKRSWQHFNNDSVDLWKQVSENNQWDRFDAYGGQYLKSQLAQNISGKIKTWFVKWHASVFLKKGLSLFPNLSMVDNIGFDNSGVHNGESTEFINKVLAKNIEVRSIAIEVSKVAETIIKDFYKPLNLYNGTLKNKISDWFKYRYNQVIDKMLPHYKYIVHKHEIHRSYIGIQVKIYPYAKITQSIIGNYTYISDNAVICNSIIGKFCSIGPNLICGWGIHPLNGISSHPMFYSKNKQNGITLSKENKIVENKIITIGNDVFIGMNVSIVDGVNIGDGAVIGAGAVVSKDIPPYAIAVGCPIKIIGYRFDAETIEKFLTVKWWDFENEKLPEIENKFFNVNDFLQNH